MITKYPVHIFTFVLLLSLSYSQITLADPRISYQPISFNKGISYNDIFVTYKMIEYLHNKNIPFYVSNEGVIYVEEKNENKIHRNDPTDGLGLIQFPDISKATVFMSLLIEKEIEFFPTRSGGSKYFNIYYQDEKDEVISNEIMPLFRKMLESGAMFSNEKK